VKAPEERDPSGTQERARELLQRLKQRLFNPPPATPEAEAAALLLYLGLPAKAIHGHAEEAANGSGWVWWVWGRYRSKRAPIPASDAERLKELQSALKKRHKSAVALTRSLQAQAAKYRPVWWKTVRCAWEARLDRTRAECVLELDRQLKQLLLKTGRGEGAGAQMGGGGKPGSSALIDLFSKYIKQHPRGGAEGFIAWLRERGWSERSLRTAAYYLRSVGFKDLKPPQAKRAEREALSEEELRRILEEARSRGYYHCVLTGLLGLLGLRVSEALSLKWEDVDLERGLIAVRGARPRLIPIPRQLLDYLRAHRPNRGDARVLPRTSSWVWQALRDVSERAIGRPVAPSALRLAYARILLARGVDALTVQQLLGETPRAAAAVDANRIREIVEQALT